jgi:histidine phosphotransfer protein HptB
MVLRHRGAVGGMMIDWGRVRDLRSEIGADDFAEVVAMFLDEADEVIARLTAERGAKALESDLHFLKGAALNLGFDALAAICQDGERRAAAGDVGFDLEQVRRTYFASKSGFDAGLAQALAA